jgi:hypothetical protein
MHVLKMMRTMKVLAAAAARRLARSHLSTQNNFPRFAMKSKWLLSLSTCVVLMGTAATLPADEQRHGDGKDNDNHFSDSRIRRGFAIAPVRLALRGKNFELVGLGSYLVNALGGCNDCHTRPSYVPGGDPALGEPPIINSEEYLTGGRQFGPTITSPNLTPDEHGRPAGLTFEEFKSAIRTGRDPDGSNRILQVMPWPVYANMTNNDLRAIYEFLRAIPSRPDNPNPGP